MADGAFQAGLELAEKAGIFCINTSRQIKFSRAELLAALRTAPRSLRIGSGKDQRVIEAAEWGKRRKPFIWAGFSGAPLTEQTYRSSVRSYIKEPLVDALGHGSLYCVDGIEVRSDSPLEVRATRQELMYIREGLRAKTVLECFHRQQHHRPGPRSNSIICPKALFISCLR
jgi:methylamine--corrinoid protein Co-methyltransferase